MERGAVVVEEIWRMATRSRALREGGDGEEDAMGRESTRWFT
jgi:hypothetical protein